MPAKIIELAEGQQNDGDATQQENETDGRPQKCGARGMIASERVIGKIVRIGMRRSRPLGNRAPGRPGEEGGKIVQLFRIGNEVSR